MPSLSGNRNPRSPGRSQRRRRRSRRSVPTLRILQQVLLQRTVHLLRPGQISRLQRRSQLAEQLAYGTRSARTTVTADPAAMMMVVRISLRRLSLRSLILEVLSCWIVANPAAPKRDSRKLDPATVG